VSIHAESTTIPIQTAPTHPEYVLMRYATELFAIWYWYHAGQKQKPLSMLVLAYVSIIAPLNPLTKVVNLFLPTLLKAMVGGMLNATSSTTWQCSFIPHPLYPSYPLNTSWGNPHRLHIGKGKQILPLPGTTIPCYPAHTLISNINYTLCEWC
jgi:hypothetical protein